MGNQRSRFVTQLVCRLAAAIGLLIGMANTGLAQQMPGPPAGGPNMKEEMRRQEMRETMLRNTELGAAVGKRDQKRLEAALEQVQQDFKQIQIVRNAMVRNLIANKPFDYKLISDEAAEINKRAERLKSYLMPSAPENKDKNQKSPVDLKQPEMKGALVQLCNQIALFIENPILKTPGVTDVTQSAKAGGELLRIIEMSGNIKRSAEQMSKTPKQ